MARQRSAERAWARAGALSALTLLAGACRSTPAAPTSSAVTSPSAPTAAVSVAVVTPAPSPSPVATATPRPTTTTLGDLARVGKDAYATNCARCHGDQGRGSLAPALIGPDNHLARFQTGKALYDYVRQLMPQDAAGSLSPDVYRQILALILVENHFAPATAPADTLDTTRL